MIETLDSTAPQSVYSNTRKFGGANTNALALTPDERTLLVSNGGENAVAVVQLSERARGVTRGVSRHGGDQDEDGDTVRSSVIGLLPTGWYPTGVATSKDGATWYIVNGKSNAGPNLIGCAATVDPGRGSCVAETERSTETPASGTGADKTSRGMSQGVWELEKAGFLTLPKPSALELARLTQQVAHNDRFDQPESTAAEEQLFSFLRQHIKHVIYIIKENRTYDQVLGDLEIGNGDPHLALFPEKITPNHHAIARDFVTLDNMMASGETSDTGWPWSVSAQTNDFTERATPLWEAGRGLEFDQEGSNRNVNMGYATAKERRAWFSSAPKDPDILPGTRDVAAPDGPDGEEGRGYLWDSALKAGLTLRNWGFFADNRNYLNSFDARRSTPIPLIRDPYAQKRRVFFPTNASLMRYSDPYYRSFEPAFPDYWRVQEWTREFKQFSAARPAPALMLVRLCTDHFGDFGRAIDGVDTVDTQMADNDYALGLVLETVAGSPFANDTLIVSIEDDAADGVDHVDAHRTVALFAGAYVRRRALVTRRFTTVNVVKTIEKVLGLDPIGLNDALAAPMAEVFDRSATNWSYQAIVPDVLRSTRLPLPPAPTAPTAVPRHSAAYWIQAMAGQDFSSQDRIEPKSFNHALWKGLAGNAPYPAMRSGANLRANRAELLRAQ